MDKIKTYVKESFEANRVRRWNKKVVLVFIMQITYPEFKHLQKEYQALIKRGLDEWNRYTNGKVCFKLTDNQQDADITVKFTRVSINYWGMCWYDSVVNSEFKKLTVSLGLSNKFNGAKLTNNDRFVLVLHEFGHALGLGHCPNTKNIMCSGYYPKSNHISLGDIITLNILYDLPVGSYYENVKDKVSKLEEDYCSRIQKDSPEQIVEKKSINDNLEEIARLNMYKMDLNNTIKLPTSYVKQFHQIRIESEEKDKNKNKNS